MQLSVVFICASFLVFTAESRGGKRGHGGKRGSSGHGKRGNKSTSKGEVFDTVPAWTKYRLVLKWKSFIARKMTFQITNLLF